MITLRVAADLLIGDQLPTLIQRSASWNPDNSGAINFNFNDDDSIINAADAAGIGFVGLDDDTCIAVNAPGRYEFFDNPDDNVDPDGDLDPDHDPDADPDDLEDATRPPVRVPAVTPVATLEHAVEGAREANVEAAVTTPHVAIPVVAAIGDFASMYRRFASSSMTASIDAVTRLRMRVDSLAAQLVVAQREMNSHLHRTQVTDYNVVCYNKLVDAIERTRQCEDVESIGIYGNYLVVKTKEISTVVPIGGHRRLVGHMLIGFNIRWLANPSVFGENTHDDATVRIWNTDRECDGYQCGHVHDTYPCLGGYMSQLAMAVAECHFDQMVEIMLRFLKNPEPTDGYCRHLGRWPIAPEVTA